MRTASRWSRPRSSSCRIRRPASSTRTRSPSRRLRSPARFPSARSSSAAAAAAHVGAVEALATRVDRLGVVWFDAHGDLNTPESSPSGNPWGMPLRMLIDSDTVAAEDVALVGARNLDPPEESSSPRAACVSARRGSAEALDGVDAVYVAFDCDVLEPDCGASDVHAGAGRDDSRGGRGRPRRTGPAQARRRLGFSGLAADPQNSPVRSSSRASDLPARAEQDERLTAPRRAARSDL